MDKEIIISNQQSITGDTLFCRRDTYIKGMTFWDKVCASFRNRLV